MILLIEQYNMSTEKNNDVVRKRQEALDAKQNEIVENLDNVSLKEVKESKEEAKQLGDSEKEQTMLFINYRPLYRIDSYIL